MTLLHGEISEKGQEALRAVCLVFWRWVIVSRLQEHDGEGKKAAALADWERNVVKGVIVEAATSEQTLHSIHSRLNEDFRIRNSPFSHTRLPVLTTNLSPYWQRAQTDVWLEAEAVILD